MDQLAEWGAATSACASVWTKTATGADAAPSFDSTITGTAARARMACGLWQLDSGFGNTRSPTCSTPGRAPGPAGAP